MVNQVKLTKDQKDLCRIIFPVARLSYPHLFQPHSPNPKDKKKYSATILLDKKGSLIGQFPEGNPRSIQEALNNCKIVTFGPDKTKWPKGLLSPIQDGDKPANDGEVRPGYAGHWAIKLTSNEDQKPELVFQDAKTPILEAKDLYPGCYVKVFGFSYYWTYMGKQGIGFILDAVQFVRDGKSFGGKKPASEIFSPLAIEEPAEAGDDFEGFSEEPAADNDFL